MTLLFPSPLGHSPRPCHPLQRKICDLLRCVWSGSSSTAASSMTPPAHPGPHTTPRVGYAMRWMATDGSATDGARRKHLDHLTGVWDGAALPAERGHTSGQTHCPLPAPDWSHRPPSPRGRPHTMGWHQDQRCSSPTLARPHPPSSAHMALKMSFSPTLHPLTPGSPKTAMGLPWERCGGTEGW